MVQRMVMAVMVCLFLCNMALAQKISKVDFDDIKKKVEDVQSPYYYPNLVKRYQYFDSTLRKADFLCLYYGHIFQKNYDPYGGDDNETKCVEQFRIAKYEQVIKFGEKALAQNPVNLKVLYRVIVSYDRLNNRYMANRYARFYFPMIDCIMASGDGKSKKTAYVVTDPSDEYEVLNHLDLRSFRQSLDGDTDILTIDTSDQRPMIGKALIREMYFNVSKPMQRLTHSMKGKE